MLNNATRLAALSLSCWFLIALAQTPPAPAPETPPTPAPAVPAAAPAAEAPAKQESTQKIGKETKLAIGKVLDLEKADNGCLINFREEKSEAVELGLAEFCTKKPSIKGQRLHFVYKVMNVLSDECLGNPKCKKMEERPIIVEANALR